MNNLARHSIWAFALAILTLAGCTKSPESPKPPDKLDVTIVKADSTAWLAEHATEELAAYIRRMTGINAQITQNIPEPAKTQTVLILSLDSAAEQLKQLPGADNPEQLRDGFVIQSKGPGKLTIAATQPSGLLYGVYEYLEHYCGCGFFWDGDYVPKRSDLPIANIDLSVLPRWPVRHFAMAHGWGLNKWHHLFRTPQQRRQILNWMAKRKINISYIPFIPNIPHTGVVATQIFGITDTEPDNHTNSGWPGELGFPAEYRTKLLKDSLEYGRQRGVKRVMHMFYGSVPYKFRDAHPEYKYVAGTTTIHPTDPACAKWSKTLSEAIIDTFGTDHIYMDTPFVETTGVSDLDESFQLKLDAALGMCKVLKELDKDAIWQWDSWDFQAVPSLWTPERVKRYFDNLPTEMMTVYDTAGIINPQYKKTKYFEGANWTLGILHAFQGDDHLHGNLNMTFNAMQELSADPRADKCEGIYHIPEISGHNVLYFDMTTNLAWNPDNYPTMSSYLNEYTQRRFGTQDYVEMRLAVEFVTSAVYGPNSSSGGQMPIYQKFGSGYATGLWPIMGSSIYHPAEDGKGIYKLHNAVQSALKCRKTQKNNDLYVNDMVDWTRTYLAHVFNWATINAAKNFHAGQAGQMEPFIALARQCLKQIESILSTRPDFSLQKQIDWAMSVPGTNPYLPWYFKQHCATLYSGNEVYEQLHWFYGPRMEVYFRELETRVAQGIKTITWNDIASQCGAIGGRWLNEDISVPNEENFQGSSMDSLTQAFQTVNQTALLSDFLAKAKDHTDVEDQQDPDQASIAQAMTGEHWRTLFTFLRDIKDYSGSTPIEPLRTTYLSLIGNVNLASQHTDLTLSMAQAEKKAGNGKQVSSLIQSLTDPFVLRDLVRAIHTLAPQLVDQQTTGPQGTVRPLLVPHEDGSVKLVKKDQRLAVTTQRQQARLYIYFTLPNESELRNINNTVKFNIDYYSDGNPGRLIVVQYDSHSSPYSSAALITPEETVGWHSATVDCPNARFVGSQNSGCDFRIAAPGQQDIFIGGITIELLE